MVIDLTIRGSVMWPSEILRSRSSGPQIQGETRTSLTRWFDGSVTMLEPLDSSEEGSAIANKTGALDEVRNDVDAVATKNGLLILSIFTWDNKDQSWTDDNEAYLTTAKIAKAIVGTWAPDGLDVKAFELPK